MIFHLFIISSAVQIYEFSYFHNHLVTQCVTQTVKMFFHINKLEENNDFTSSIITSEKTLFLRIINITFQRSFSKNLFAE